MLYLVYFPIHLQIFVSFVTANPFIGGENIVPAEKNEFPFIVSIGFNVDDGGHICTGSLITCTHVLTAAHCTEIVRRPRNVRVLVGTNDLDNGGTKYRLSTVDNWVTYNDWAQRENSSKTIYECNDIAIFTLSNEVTKNIQMPKISSDSDDKHYNKVAVAVGWGELSGGVKPNLLQKVSLNVMNKTECENTLEKLGYSRTEAQLNEICTVADPPVVPGMGDSGGPLLINGNEIIGVSQAFCPEDQPNHPDVYNIHVSIDFYRSFIYNVTNIHL
ncbi:chymotrypsin-1-like [Phymastichus coffea]|uniref:chymotrypsin-1-like n=1 Tax=Phymastichus coffea TaxID=108790 RepID=UPI00273B921C|nr:chymotrypsin-1-like [Phymastichus coffea]